MNLDPKKLEKLITKKTKAVIYQGTLGETGWVEEIKKICNKHNLLLIEDLAHGLGNNSLGKNGTAAFLSFGRDKVISSIWGGAVITDDEKLAGEIERVRDLECQPYKKTWVAKQLLYVPFTYLVMQTYSFFYFGKFLHIIFSKLNLLPKVLDSSEKQGRKQEIFHKGMPGPLSVLALRQLNKLGEFIDHRRKIARLYDLDLHELATDSQESSFLRYSIFVDDPKNLRRFASAKNIFLGDWYDSIVAPKGVNLEAVKYTLGSCPQAEMFATKIVNLPTSPATSLENAKKVIKIIQQWNSKK